jgi:hypothetical protein
VDDLLTLEHCGDVQEGLYEEDAAKKVKATGMIAQLFRNTEYLEVGTAAGGGRSLNMPWLWLTRGQSHALPGDVPATSSSSINSANTCPQVTRMCHIRGLAPIIV